jgi:drug/metabolite transporter (DMT)-like permease
MHPTINRTMTPTEWLMLLGLASIWGGSFFFTGVALREIPPSTLVLLRVGLAALILNLLLPVLGHRLPSDRRIWRDLLVMGVLNNAAPFCLIVWGQTHIASGLAAVLNATTPLATVLVANLVTSDERLTLNRLVGVLIGMAGVVVMIGPAVLHGLGATALAQLAILGAAVSYACAGVFGRRFGAMGLTPIVTATGQVTGSALLLLPVALLADHPWTMSVPGVATMAAVLALAALSTALAYVLYFRILASAGATNLLLVTFLVPITAILLGSVVLGERLDAHQIMGMALIGLSLAAIDGRPLSRIRALSRAARSPVVPEVERDM